MFVTQNCVTMGWAVDLVMSQQQTHVCIVSVSVKGPTKFCGVESCAAVTDHLRAT